MTVKIDDKSYQQARKEAFERIPVGFLDGMGKGIP